MGIREVVYSLRSRGASEKEWRVREEEESQRSNGESGM